MSKKFLSGINVIGGTTLNGVTDAGVDTDKFIVLDSNGVIKYRTGDEILSDVGAVSSARTLSINGTSYDLSADRSWTISTSSSARSIQKFVATAGQTTFTITGGYTVGLVDVYVNGVKLDNSGDFTATNGSTIVLTTGTLVNNIVEVYKYINAFTANNALRVSTYFTATAGQTTFTATYSLGLIDVFYNGSKLSTSEYNASSGTSIVLNNACSVNDIIEIIAYNYSVGGFTGVSQTRTLTINGTAYDLSADRAWTLTTSNITEGSNLYYTDTRARAAISLTTTGSSGASTYTSGVINIPTYTLSGLGGQTELNGTGLVRMAGTTVSYDNATYATQSYVTTAVSNLVNAAPSTLDTLNELATALGNDANFSTTVTTSIGTKQPQLNGTGFVKISGTTISYDNSTYLTTASASSTYLPLAGGTLTGALGGTSASFSSSVTATQFNVSTSGGATQIYNTGGGHTVITNATANKDMNYQVSGTGGHYFSGAATFSSSVSAATNFISVPNTDSISVGTSLAENAKYNYLGHSGYWGIKTTTGFNFALDTYNGGTPKNVLTITQAGAATFSSSVTIGGTFVQNPTSGTGGLYIDRGTSSTSPYISWFNGSGTRLGYMGYSNSNIGLYLENSANFTITGGNVGIGTGSPGCKLDITGGYMALNDYALRWRFASDANHATVFTTNYNGPIMYGYSGAALGYQAIGVIWTNTTSAYNYNNSTTWQQTSDIRIKENIRPITGALSKICSLNPTHFEYKNKLGKTKTGFIAQEFEQVFEGHVIESEPLPEYQEYFAEGEKIKSIDADLIPYLVKAIQELKAEIDILKAR